MSQAFLSPHTNSWFLPAFMECTKKLNWANLRTGKAEGGPAASAQGSASPAQRGEQKLLLLFCCSQTCTSHWIIKGNICLPYQPEKCNKLSTCWRHKACISPITLLYMFLQVEMCVCNTPCLHLSPNSIQAMCCQHPKASRLPALILFPLKKKKKTKKKRR